MPKPSEPANPRLAPQGLRRLTEAEVEALRPEDVQEVLGVTFRGEYVWRPGEPPEVAGRRTAEILRRDREAASNVEPESEDPR